MYHLKAAGIEAKKEVLRIVTTRKFIRWLKLIDTPEIISIAKEMDIEVDTFPHLFLEYIKKIC
ncbi:hypothetical protein [Lebetimonas sp. JH292]|uniref:hypothetical protein n=1 Tax=Lebetimonas sp. JH292 TaxID=990068 RepID=UPI0004647AED|nr:hypothetical protein [Lebetimonas sp. JH292]